MLGEHNCFGSCFMFSVFAPQESLRGYTVELLEQDYDGLWVVTSEEIEITKGAVRQVVDAEYGQRQQDRRHNPHGEHAEEVFTLLTDIPTTVLGRYIER